MKKKRNIVKKKIRKKIELRDNNDFLELSKGINKKMDYSDERTKARLFGLKIKQVKKELSKKPKKEIRISDYKIKDHGIYIKKENVDYDIMIYIATYNRYDFLYQLLTQLFSQETKYTFKIVINDDGSDDSRYNKLIDEFPEVILIKNEYNLGREGYWLTTKKMWDVIKNYKCHAIVQIDDDFKLCDNFLNLLMNNFFEIKKENNSYMGIRYHIGLLNNNNYDPDVYFNRKFRFQGVDGGTLFDSTFFELFNYEIDEIYHKNRKQKGHNIWMYLNDKLVELGVQIHVMRKSLAYHEGIESKMYPILEKRKVKTMNFIEEEMNGTTYNIKLNNGKTLLAGPWVGEFGWELFCWQGYIRNISQNYNKVIVISRKGHDFLYQDFCDEFIEFNPPKNSIVDSWRCSNIDKNEIKKIISRIPHDDSIYDFNIGFTLFADGKHNASNNFKNQKFIKYKSNTIYKEFDILIHPRNRKVGGVRNWGKEKWQDLVNRLKDEYKIAMIGSNETYNLENVEDFRNIKIEDTVSLMNRTKLVVGPSSGPMHLASLSGAPHLVWSTSHNKIRYKNLWNPFNTEIYFYDKEDWNPKVENIINKIKEILK